MRVKVRVGLGLGIAIAAVACSFDLADVVPPDGELPGFGIDAGGDGPTVTPPPPGPPAPPPPPGGCPPPSTCTITTPNGWQVIAFATSAAPCPEGLDETAVVIDPTSDGSASCACGACTGVTPACGATSIASNFDTGVGTCAQPGQTIAANNGNCKTLSGTLGSHSQFIPPPAAGGTCTSASTGNANGFKTTKATICTPAAGCAPPSCAASAPPFNTCVVRDGDVPCPDDLKSRTLVGNDITVACPACPCTVTANCNGSLAFYGDLVCLVGVVDTVLVNNACLGTSGSAFKSYRFTAAPTNVVCTPGPAPAGTASLTVPRTVCCP